jgi:hypothetical protein
MKKIIGALFLFAMFFAGTVNATVGGSTYVYNLKYNPYDESLYYLKVSEGGRGCPPEIMKLPLASGVTSVFFDCVEAEKLLYEKFNKNYELLKSSMNDMIAGYKDLKELNLSANKIDIDVDFLRDDTFGDTEKYVYNKTHDVFVYQNGIKVDTFQIQSCLVDMPITFAGYIIPGFEKKIAMVASGGGDCMEGPYVSETVKIVSGVQVNYKQTAPIASKISGQLIANDKTLTVKISDEVDLQKYVAKKDEPKMEESVNADNAQIPVYVYIIVVLSILAGIIIGRKTKAENIL